MICLNNSEKQQAHTLLKLIRLDVPNNPQPARAYIPLVRGRVCVWLNEQINAGLVSDILVDRTRRPDVDYYYHK